MEAASCLLRCSCAEASQRLVDRWASVLQLRTGVTMVQTEGYAALMSGVSATVARGLFYGGVLQLSGPSTAHPMSSCAIFKAAHAFPAACGEEGSQEAMLEANCRECGG